MDERKGWRLRAERLAELVKELHQGYNINEEARADMPSRVVSHLNGALRAIERETGIRAR